MKFHKTLLVTLLSSLSVAALAQDKIQNVAITAIVEHPALDSIRKGVIEELAREGFVDGKNIKIDYQSAQGSTATAAQIARKFVGDKADIIIPITTPSAITCCCCNTFYPNCVFRRDRPGCCKISKIVGAKWH